MVASPRTIRLMFSAWDHTINQDPYSRPQTIKISSHMSTRPSLCKSLTMSRLQDRDPTIAHKVQFYTFGASNYGKKDKVIHQTI